MTTTNEIIYNHGHPIILLLLLLASPAAAQTGRDDRDSPPPPPTYEFNARFNPSMAIIIAVLISAFFLMGFFSIYVRRCIGENGSVGGGAHAIAGRIRSRRGPRGLDAEVIETFPTFEYSVVKNLKLGNGTLECAVCLNEFENEETLRLLPKCNHVFHPECIDAWLATHTTCPVCRCNLEPGSDTAAAETREPDGVGSEIRPAEINNENEVVITIDEALPPREPEPTLEATPPKLINPISNPISNRPPRSKSSRWLGWSGKFPRSHSTGHSLVQPGENMDRFTLRLPEHIRGELVKGKLNRTTSCLLPADGTVTDGSVRRGFRSGSQGSSRGRAYGRLDRGAKSERWVFSMAPPFISRSFSARSPSNRGGAVKMPFDCISGASAGGDSEESVIPPRSATPVFTVAQPP